MFIRWRATRGSSYAGINIEESLLCRRKRARFHRKSISLRSLCSARCHRSGGGCLPADLTLARLHDVLQSAMGWQDCHMHEFSAGHRHFGKPNPEDRLMGMPPVENERTVRLSTVLSRAGAKAIYTYDMGDSWEHGIVLEKRLPVD